MSLFGHSTADKYTRSEALRIAQFLRREPLWPLLAAILKLRFGSEPKPFRCECVAIEAGVDWTMCRIHRAEGERALREVRPS